MLVSSRLKVVAAGEGFIWHLEGEKGVPRGDWGGTGVLEGGSSTNRASRRRTCKSVQQMGRTNREMPACSHMRS